MCGIVGFTFARGLAPDVARAQHQQPLRRMVASLRHRGPDALHATILDGAALGHARLSIVDVAAAHQPMSDPDTGLTVVFNGEIYNHVELRERLRESYRFRTRSDTEVILAAFLADGIECVQSFNGQFAFALYDPRDGSLWLARDRYGKRPLFYCDAESELAWASEAKALFAGGVVSPKLDRKSLLTTLHLWAPAPGASAFEAVHALPPGCYAHKGRDSGLELHEYWSPDLSDERVERGLDEPQALEQLASLLDDAIRLRLRADVPVAAYLSGGLDSSLICALAQRELGGTLRTFSVSFDEARFDESAYQHEVARELSTAHEAVRIGEGEIAELFPQVVAHAENVLLRSAPAPFYRLSALVRRHGIKVVLTGEGADEVFLGYDLFKETQVRSFWARQPDSVARPRLFERLYPYLPIARQSPAMLRQFYGIALDRPGALEFSHLIRWRNSGRIARFLSQPFLESVAGFDPIGEFLAGVPQRVCSWRPLARAQYLEIRTLLPGYLLSSQGDRMLMAHSVEGRFPFLDHRLLDFAARLPDHLKLRVLTEKYLLKRFAEPRLPTRVIARHKFPYRAPGAARLVGSDAPSWARQALCRDGIESTGIFDPSKVAKLCERVATGATVPSEADSMALYAIASAQLLASVFVSRRADALHEHEVEPWSP